MYKNTTLYIFVKYFFKSIEGGILSPMEKSVERFDERIINLFRHYGDEFGRFSFFVVFFWFGILKVLQLSPAESLVAELLQNTFLNVIPEASFLAIFGLFEMIIGILILFPKFDRVNFLIIVLHFITTAMPLVILPNISWHALMVPTLVGQYIIKNLVLLAFGVMLVARMKPMSKTHHFLAEEEESIPVHAVE